MKYAKVDEVNSEVINESIK